jgi:hypothetical protein
VSEQEPVIYVDIKNVDQEALQAEYEVGTLSLRELSAKFGMDPKKGHVYIKRLADRKGWTKDLKAQIQAKAESKLQRQALPKEAQAAPKIADASLIEANAEAVFQVRHRHRRDIARGMGLTMRLLEELEHHTDNRELLEQLGDLMAKPDDKGKDKLGEIYQAVISLPERTKTVKALSETLKNLVGMEREAYNILLEEPEKGKTGGVSVTIKQYGPPKA